MFKNSTKLKKQKEQLSYNRFLAQAFKSSGQQIVNRVNNYRILTENTSKFIFVFLEFQKVLQALSVEL